MPKARGKHIESTGGFGFDEWGLDSLTQFQDLLSRMIKEGLELAAKEYKCHAWFPIEWTPDDGLYGSVPEDPTTIYVELPLGEGDCEGPTWAFALSDCVNSVIETREAGPGGVIAKKDREPLVLLRDDLRRLADVLDAALQRKVG